MKPRRNLNWLLATVGGVGQVPIAPGTFASLLAIPAAGLILQLSFGRAILAGAALLVFGVGVWATQNYSSDIGQDDPGDAVIDEVAGQWLALLAASPTNVWHFLAGFALFRFFDIAKPWPVNWAQRAFPGGWGIMLDDVAAGLCALAIMSGGIWAWSSPYVAVVIRGLG